MKKHILTLAALLLPAAAGCLPDFPENTNFSTASSVGVVTREILGARFIAEENVGDADWLEIDRQFEDGVVGGYFAEADAPRGALIVLLDGASTYSIGGIKESSFIFHSALSPPLRAHGFSTWTVATRECGEAYGQGDLRDALEALDWLADGGDVILNVERVYVVGYSVGATVAILADRERPFAAAVSLAGLTQPDQLEDMYNVYRLAPALYPNNIGMCQMGDTLNFYGPPGDGRWDALDTVAHVDDLLNPMLLIHGEDDRLFYTENTRALQRAYDARVAEGAALPPLEFVYLPAAAHIGLPSNPDAMNAMTDYLLRMEASLTEE